MKSKFQSTSKQILSEDELEHHIAYVLDAEGWMIPETDDEVKKAEEDMEQSPIELPPQLRDPVAVFEAITHDSKILPYRDLTYHDTTELMARAAREGGDIPPEIEERMRRDRQATKDAQDDATE